MGKLYVNNGAWRTVKIVAVNVSGTWQYIKTAWVREGGVWRIFYGGNSGTQTFSVGTTTWTVPDGVYSITVSGCGGGGSGGGGDGGANYNGPGGGGGGSNLISSSYSVLPAQVLNITVGAGGQAAPPYGGTGANGGTTTVSGTGVSFSAAGGQAGQGYYDGALRGLGANGANWATRTRSATAGTSTNGGSNGGAGGGREQAGGNGQAGKLSITY